MHKFLTISALYTISAPLVLGSFSRAISSFTDFSRVSSGYSHTSFSHTGYSHTSFSFLAASVPYVIALLVRYDYGRAMLAAGVDSRH